MKITESIKTTINQIYNTSGRWFAFAIVAIFLFMTFCLIRSIIKDNHRYIRWYWNVRESMVIYACLLIVTAIFTNDPNMNFKTVMTDTVSVTFVAAKPNETVNLHFPFKDEQGNEVFSITDTVECQDLEPGKEYKVSGQLCEKDKDNIENSTVCDPVRYSSGLDPDKKYVIKGSIIDDPRLQMNVNEPTEYYKQTLRITFLCCMGIVLYLLSETIILFVRKRCALVSYDQKQKRPDILFQSVIVYCLYLIACISKLTGSIVAMSIFVIYITIKRFVSSKSV